MRKANQLKLARVVAGYTQYELAQKLGITTAAVSQWESGASRPGVRLLKPLAEVLNTTVDKLLEDEERVV